MNEQTEAVQSMQDYILSHITEEITLCDLASTAHFSPWYADRLLNEKRTVISIPTASKLQFLFGGVE